MGQQIAHPSEFIDAALTDILRQHAAAAEELKDLHPDQWSVIYDQRWFKMFVPQVYTGLEWSLPEVLRVEESLSWVDGSVGWIVTLCAGAGWFAGFLSAEAIKEITSDRQFCIAGSGAASGTANVTGDGFEVNGIWKYASGSLHATAFTANCIIQRNGVDQFMEDGSPLIRAFLLHRNEVMLHPHWNSIGMIATGSHTFEVKALHVHANRCFDIESGHPVMNDTVYRYPFAALAETTLAVNLSGMAVRFLDLCDPLFGQRMNKGVASGMPPDLHQSLFAARDQLNQCRYDFYQAVDATWSICARGEMIPEGKLQQVSKASYLLAGTSVRVVDKLYPLCGLAAANKVTEINRVWRNLHTASQHSLFGPAWTF